MVWVVVVVVVMYHEWCGLLLLLLSIMSGVGSRVRSMAGVNCCCH